ncbi:hypothetical protein F5Y14DRAFT_97950 [Nemania sp. NC0429]|nr:hypothetical protein F5Y14DRAFT_97950 [Nemania sp. NC0429]
MDKTMASDERPFWDPDDSDEDIYSSTTCEPTTSIQSSFDLPASTSEARPEPLIAAPLPAPDQDFDALEPLRLTFGEESEKGSTFMLFKLVQAYLYTYFGQSKEQKVLEFFKKRLPKTCAWDFFSQHDATATRNPLLLVPTSQLERYLDNANHQLDMQFAIPHGSAGDKFSLTFGEWDTPRPRFLGRANDASAINALKARAHELPTPDLTHLAPERYRMYCDKLDKIYGLLGMARSRGNRGGGGGRARAGGKRWEKRVQRQKDYGRMLKRAQRYLGLREAISQIPSRGSVTTNWDVSMPAPFKPRESVRLVCIDFEAYERDNRAITEIGLAVLDTDDLVDTNPGMIGEKWFSLIQAYHLRVKERCYMINTEFVQGCPEAFNFGESQILPLNDITGAVGTIIGGKAEDERPVIIVGHDVGRDLDYLIKIGYNHWDVPQIVDEIDTRGMFQREERNLDGRGLSTMCASLGISGHNYHNAGNDAVYTLQAMIAMAIKRTVEGSDRNDDSFTPGTDEWTDGEMDDGGGPKRSARPA